MALRANLTRVEVCAGAGGGLLGAAIAGGQRTVLYVENEPACVEILKARIRDGLLDDAPIWDDLKTVEWGRWRGRVDLLSGGVELDERIKGEDAKR